jgi:hypothetical protein
MVEQPCQIFKMTVKPDHPSSLLLATTDNAVQQQNYKSVTITQA